MNGVHLMSNNGGFEEPLPPGDEVGAITPPPTKKAKSESGSSWQPKMSFLSSPVYDLKQTGDCKFSENARSPVLGLLGGALPRLSSEQMETVNKAKKYAMEQSIKMVLMKQTLAHQQQFIMKQLASQRTQVQRQQALALMCRVYVGSISFELKEDTIRGAFLPFGPIKSINMSWDPVTQKHKGFAFVEYEIPEGAQLALEQMNGAMMGGRNIKVGRPSNMPQAQQVIDEIQEEAKNYNRIFIASVHPDLDEEDIKSVFEAFGPILYCRMAQGNSLHTHKGYGFIEYANKQAADEAIASMNLFDLGGQLLRVGRAITPPNALMAPSTNSTMPTAAAVAAAAATAKIQAMDSLSTPSTAASSTATIQVSQHPGISTTIPVGQTVAHLPPPALAIPQPASVLHPPQIVTPVLGSKGTIQVATPPSSSGTASLSTSAVSTTTPEPTTSNGSPGNSNSAHEVLKKVHEKQQEELQKKLLEEEPQTLQQQESISIKGQNARHLVMQRLMRPRESKVIILRNMVGPEDVDDMLQEEIQDECSKYGQVDGVIIYNEKQSDNEFDDMAEVIVKIFVQFSSPIESTKAKDALDGRYFGGRLVKAELYDQALFDHNDLSG